MRTAPYFHNQVGILTEVALHRYATPKYYEPDSLPKAFRGGKAADRASVWYPDPWKGGWWRIGDAVDYFLTASMGALEAAAGMRESWLFNIYQMGRDAIEEGAESPFAYLVPLERQRDAGEALELLRILKLGGIRVERATAGFTAGGESFPAGTFVLRAAQPYRAHLVDLLEPQDYPDRRQYPGGPPVMPYDLTGWTLPLQMGVSVTRIDEPVEIPLEEAAELMPSPGSIVGEASEFLLSPASNLAYVAVNRLVDDGVGVGRLASSHASKDGDLPPGTFVVRATAADLRPLAEELGLDFQAAESGMLDSPEVIRFRAPSVGLYRSWVPSMDEGWARWVLERYEFDYTSLSDADVRKGVHGRPGPRGRSSAEALGRGRRHADRGGRRERLRDRWLRATGPQHRQGRVDGITRRPGQPAPSRGGSRRSDRLRDSRGDGRVLRAKPGVRNRGHGR